MNLVEMDQALVKHRSTHRSPIWKMLKSRRSARSTWCRWPFLMIH